MHACDLLFLDFFFFSFLFLVTCNTLATIANDEIVRNVHTSRETLLSFPSCILTVLIFISLSLSLYLSIQHANITSLVTQHLHLSPWYSCFAFLCIRLDSTQFASTDLVNCEITTTKCSMKSIVSYSSICCHAMAATHSLLIDVSTRSIELQSCILFTKCLFVIKILSSTKQQKNLHLLCLLFFSSFSLRLLFLPSLHTYFFPHHSTFFTANTCIFSW